LQGTHVVEPRSTRLATPSGFGMVLGVLSSVVCGATCAGGVVPHPLAQPLLSDEFCLDVVPIRMMKPIRRAKAIHIWYGFCTMHLSRPGYFVSLMPCCLNFAMISSLEM